MHIKELIAGLLIGVAAPAHTRAEDPAASGSPPGMVLLRHCVLEFERNTLLGSSTTGILQEVRVKPGDRVKAGAILGRLVDADIRAELVVRTAEAASDTDVRLGELKLVQTRNRLKASDTLSKRNLISNEELETHRLEAQAAELELEAARHRRHLAQLAVTQVEAMLRSREFISPHDGIVVAVLKNKGETVSLNEQVFRVVAVGSIRVSGSLDVGDAWQVRAGQRVQVTPEIPGAELAIEQQVFTGVVEYVDPEVSADHQTCKVVAVVENRGGLLRAGLEARMEILASTELSRTEKVDLKGAPR